MPHADTHPIPPFDGSGRALIIAEIAQAHDGSLGTAHAFIDAVAGTDADAIKFQTHIADAESTPAEPWRVKFSPQDDTRFDYWRRMEFSEQQWHGLAEHAREQGLIFLSTPFSPEAVDLLERVGVPAWKVGSGETGNLPLLDRMAATGKPVILSSGMSPFDELDRAVERLGEGGVPVAVLQCTTSYPVPPEKLGLNVISELRERYGLPTGLSDHSGTIYPAVAAAALGAEIIEVHVTFHRRMFGPDVPASVTVEELGELVRGVRFIETARADPIDKNAFAGQCGELRRTFGKSVVAADDLEAGTVLTPEHIALKKPGHGLPPDRWESVLGRTLTRPLRRNDLIEEDHLG